jgi:hypothetical protein
MREPNLGINRVCVECNASFWCDDGDYFCSSKCCDKYESRQCELEEVED